MLPLFFERVRQTAPLDLWFCSIGVRKSVKPSARGVAASDILHECRLVMLCRSNHTLFGAEQMFDRAAPRQNHKENIICVVSSCYQTVISGTIVAQLRPTICDGKIGPGKDRLQSCAPSSRLETASMKEQQLEELTWEWMSGTKSRTSEAREGKRISVLAPKYIDRRAFGV